MLLGPDEPEPVSTYNTDGKSQFLLVADHAGNYIPRALGRLGLTEADCKRHIAWDIGIAGLAQLLADELDAMLIRQNYSRLVIDCNRPLDAIASIPAISEDTKIPGNANMNHQDRANRVREIFRPYHAQIEAELDRRQHAGGPTALIALHSFTPVFRGIHRPWHAGLLYNRDRRFGQQLMTLLNADDDLLVGDNEPYIVSDATDYTIPVHGERRGLPHVLMEIRQDLINDEIGQREWALRLGCLLPKAYESLSCGRE
jgi:predicted N-formylglutamate amidohydrolase